MRLDIQRKKRDVSSWKRRFDDESGKSQRRDVVRDIVSVLLLEVFHLITILTDVEWAFMQEKMGDPLHDVDRLESGSLNDSDGGEECDAILTAMRRAKRRSARPLIQPWAENTADSEMAVDDGTALVEGKTIPHVRLTVNGH